jgi:hypothetical protein
MTECVGTDALLTIGDALEWNVAEGIRHVETCDECRAELEAMRLTRAALRETEALDAAVVDRISTAVGAAARRERSEVRRRHRWIDALEPVVAGIAALIVLTSSGIGIASAATALLGFTLGAVLMVTGRMLARSVPLL